ncbi:MAG: hypothetical protein NVSMB46_02350 [Candidatus Saccharimonadales bacterium]
MEKFNQIPDDSVITTTSDALTTNGFHVTVVDDLMSAKETVLGMIPKGSEVFTATSVTVDESQISKIINESGEYNAVRPQLFANMNDESKKQEMRRLGAAPDYVIGSVHAVTQKGEVVVASYSGSQLSSYVSGAQHVIWVVGVQKIVNDLSEAFERIQTYTYPLEDARAQSTYGIHSSINKLLTIYKETPGRIEIVLVKQVVGF